MPRRSYTDLGYQALRLRLVLSDEDWAELRDSARKQGCDPAAMVGTVLHMWCSDVRHARKEGGASPILLSGELATLLAATP